jgi:ParB-like chromosome segregation protein Spo0J
MTTSFTMPIIRDPGVGEGRAEIGSEQWARRIRAQLGSMVPNIANGPKGVAGYLRLLREREGWRLLTDKNGRVFTSLEDFCETPTPWGLGTKLSDLERWIRADGPASAPIYWTPPVCYPPSEDDTGTIEVHPAAHLFPMLPDSVLADLAADIAANGLREPIVLWEGQVIDGRNRMTACQRAGVPPTFTTLLHCPDPVAYVLSANLHRRHLTDDDRALCAARMKAHYQEKTLAAQKAGGEAGGRGKKKPSVVSETLGADAPKVSETRWYDLAASDWKVSADAIKRADALLSQRETLPELHDAVKAGEVSLSKAATVAKATRDGVVTVEEVKAAVASKGEMAKVTEKIAATKPKREAKPKGSTKPTTPPPPPPKHPALVAIEQAADPAALDAALTKADKDSTLTDKEAAGAAYQARGKELRGTPAQASLPVDDDVDDLRAEASRWLKRLATNLPGLDAPRLRQLNALLEKGAAL